MEGKGTVQVCAQIDLTDGKQLGDDIDVIFVDSSGPLTSVFPRSFLWNNNLSLYTIMIVKYT